MWRSAHEWIGFLHMKEGKEKCLAFNNFSCMLLVWLQPQGTERGTVYLDAAQPRWKLIASSKGPWRSRAVTGAHTILPHGSHWELREDEGTSNGREQHGGYQPSHFLCLPFPTTVGSFPQKERSVSCWTVAQITKDSKTSFTNTEREGQTLQLSPSMFFVAVTWLVGGWVGVFFPFLKRVWGWIFRQCYSHICCVKESKSTCWRTQEWWSLMGEAPGLFCVWVELTQ